MLNSKNVFWANAIQFVLSTIFSIWWPSAEVFGTSFMILAFGWLYAMMTYDDGSWNKNKDVDE